MSFVEDTNAIESDDVSSQHLSTEEFDMLLYNAEIAVRHEATLQELLRAQNGAIRHLLYERNELLRER